MNPQDSSLKSKDLAPSGGPHAPGRAAVILAGGSGTRLWPLSRRSRPKQLLRLLDGRSLLREAFQRLRPILPAERIYVVALAEYISAIAEELPELPPQNLIGEPMGRDTANAIALAALLLDRERPDSIMGVFTADHVIRPVDRFVESVVRGYEAAEQHPDALITFGIKPQLPHTGMGYVQRGEPVTPALWRVQAFKEKPDLPTAQRYLTSGDYYWNSGMFVWRTRTILDEIQRNLPESYAALQPLAAGPRDSDWAARAKDIYPRLRKISIDYAVMEKAPNVLMLEMNLEWLDIGHWTSLPAVYGMDPDGNTKALPNVALRDGRNNILVSEDDHLIAAIGVNDLVIVHSPDATLICHRDQVDKIKDLVADLDNDSTRRYV